MIDVEHVTTNCAGNIFVKK